MNWMKFRLLYLFISGTAIAVSLTGIFTWGFRLSIDFTGGTIVEYKFHQSVDRQKIGDLAGGNFPDRGFKDLTQFGGDDWQFRFSPNFSQDDANRFIDIFAKDLGDKPELVRYETVGPTFSQEILKKTLIAVALASAGILLWIASQFKDIRFGVFAIVALLHDLTILIGTFAFLGHFEHVEIDILVVTAFLTTLSLSLYDTIVVYDRIRESIKRTSGLSLYELSNRSVSETIVRSLNTSLTASLVLFALFLLGGESIKWFALALLIGTISGTYSSPFVAVPLLVTWDQIRKKFKRSR